MSQSHTEAETLVAQIPWIRRIEDTHPQSPQDVSISTTVGVLKTDTHIHTIENHGYIVDRIGYDRAYGFEMYCTVHE